MYINKIISSSQQPWVRICPFEKLEAHNQQLHQSNFHHMGFTHYSQVYKANPLIEYCADRGKLCCCFFHGNSLEGVTTQSKS